MQSLWTKRNVKGRKMYSPIGGDVVLGRYKDHVDRGGLIVKMQRVWLI